MQAKALLLSALLALVLLSPVIEANSNGKHFSSGGCGCHGGSSSSVSISENFPSSYTAGQTYSIQVSLSGGVSGSKGGFNVEVDKGSFSTGGNSGVKVSGKSITHSNKASRAWNFDWTAPTSGSGTVAVGIAGLTANGGGTGGDAWTTMSRTITETVVATNNPPTATNVQISPSTATSLDDLSVAYVYNDQDGDAQSGTTIHWFKNGVQQTQFDGLLTLNKAHTVRNDDWQVQVTPSDGEDFGSTASSNIVTIFNAPPTLASSSISPTSPTTDDALTASLGGANDNDGDTLSYAYRWLLDGALQDGLNDMVTLPSYVTRVGDVWEVEIRAYDGEDYSGWVRSGSVSIGGQLQNTPPTVDSISLSPTNPTTSDSILVAITSSDADMDSIIETQFRWLRNGVVTAISTSTLDNSETNKGESWAVDVRVNDGTDWSAWTTSANVQIGNTAPLLETAALSHTEAFTDESLSVTAVMSDVDGDALTINIAWYLSGDLQSTYQNLETLPSSATTKGDVWTAIVQAYDGTETSSASETLTANIVNSEPVVDIALNDAVTSQDELSFTSQITDLDDDSTEFISIAWFRNGFREGSLDNATTVPSSYLGPGQEWSIEVVTSDGEATILSTTSVIIENAPPVARITVLTDSLFAGERTHLSGVQSTDSDSSIIRYQWSWAEGGASGIEASLLMPQTGSIDVTLVVTDSAGATNSTTIRLDTIAALPCPVLTSSVSEGEVVLDWTWGAPTLPSFEVSRNGVPVGLTYANTFTDTPSLTGISTYQVQTLIGDRVLESPCQSSSVDVLVEAPLTDAEQGPSALAGLGLGSVYAILGLLLLVSSLLRRGD